MSWVWYGVAAVLALPAAGCAWVAYSWVEQYVLTLHRLWRERDRG